MGETINTITFRIEPDDKQTLKKVAERVGLNLSTFSRQTILKRMNEEISILNQAEELKN